MFWNAIFNLSMTRASPTFDISECETPDNSQNTSNLSSSSLLHHSTPISKLAQQHPSDIGLTEGSISKVTDAMVKRRSTAKFVRSISDLASHDNSRSVFRTYLPSSDASGKTSFCLSEESDEKFVANKLKADSVINESLPDVFETLSTGETDFVGKQHATRIRPCQSVDSEHSSASMGRMSHVSNLTKSFQKQVTLTIFSESIKEEQVRQVSEIKLQGPTVAKHLEEPSVENLQPPRQSSESSKPEIPQMAEISEEEAPKIFGTNLDSNAPSSASEAETVGEDVRATSLRVCSMPESSSSAVAGRRHSKSLDARRWSANKEGTCPLFSYLSETRSILQ